MVRRSDAKIAEGLFRQGVGFSSVLLSDEPSAPLGRDGQGFHDESWVVIQRARTIQRKESRKYEAEGGVRDQGPWRTCKGACGPVD